MKIKKYTICAFFMLLDIRYPGNCVKMDFFSTHDVEKMANF